MMALQLRQSIHSGRVSRCHAERVRAAFGPHESQGLALCQEQNQLAQLREVFAASLGQFHITPKLRTAKQVSHARCPGL
jgi:hypothetical protein